MGAKVQVAEDTANVGEFVIGVIEVAVVWTPANGNDIAFCSDEATRLCSS
jgi:hypothetical protein